MKKLIACLAVLASALFASLMNPIASFAVDTVSVYKDNISGVNANGVNWIGAKGSKLYWQQGSSLYVFDKDTNQTTNLITGTFNGQPFAFAGDKLIFNVYVSSNPGQEPYVTDGTIAGTQLLKDITAGTGQSMPGSFKTLGNKVLFRTWPNQTGQRGLWVTDGTTAGTTKIRDFNYFPGMSDAAELGGRLYFGADPSGYNTTIWSTDGVSASQVSTVTTTQAKFATFGSWVYFAGEAAQAALANYNASKTGTELLRTNGTTTELAADINATGSSSPDWFAVLNSALYFSGNDGFHGSELMKFDGTVATLVKDEVAGSSSPSIQALTSFNGMLYYQANASSQNGELFSSDGTTSGTGLLADIFPGDQVCVMFCYGSPQPNSSNPSYFTEFDNKLIFGAKDGVVGGELFAITPSSIVSPPANNQVVTVTPVAPVVPVFKQPKFAMPSKIEIDKDGKVSLKGKDMDVTSVLINGKPQRIDFNSEDKLEFDTTGLANGTYDLVMKGAFGTYTVQKAIFVGEPVVTRVAGISERTMSADGGELSISGVGLDGTTQITMNGRVLDIVSKTDTKVTFKVPASTVLSRNSLMIEGSFAPMLFNNAFSYSR